MVVVFSLAGEADAASIVNKDAPLVDLLASARPHWPRGVARVFTARLPERIRAPLNNQTTKTINAFAIIQQPPRQEGSASRKYICWASVGSGGGFLAVVTRDREGYQCAWDTLIAASFINPQLTFLDFDSDSIPEVVCGGDRLSSQDREWVIARWDGRSGAVLAPRLDQPANTPWENRLIGRSIRFAPDTSGPAPMILMNLSALPSKEDSQQVTGDSVRVFYFDRRIGGYVPRR